MILNMENRLYTLPKLMKRYQLTFPFKAVIAKGRLNGTVVTIKGMVNDGDVFPDRCDYCNIQVLSTGTYFFSEVTICRECDFKGRDSGLKGEIFTPNDRVWKLAK